MSNSFLFLGAISMLTIGTSRAQGDLLVTPRRLVFEKGPAVRELNLANIGKDTARYMISMMELKMNEDGSFEQITSPDSGQNFASSHLRVYPRSVTVAPGESQVVKVQVFKANELAPGEYRSHIYLRAVPVETALGDSTEKKTADISVKLNPVFGISVPAIVRIGDNDARVTISDPIFAIKDTIPRLSFVLNRAGTMSSYGEMAVECIAPDGKTTEVGIVRGIAVYTPNKKRRFTMNLDNTKNVNYHQGKLHIIYRTEKDATIQDFSETELALH